MESYRKIKALGKGSFGCAILVQSNLNRKFYAMKIIDVSKLDRKQKEDALKEVKLLKQLKHPFIIQYRESFMDQNRYLCIVMDYAEKGDVHSLILQKKKSKEQFTEQEILKFFIQICFGLKFIHDQNILHRDLKTQNIFLNQKNEIKIGDFGIAKTLKNQDDMAQTAIGTPYYLSPEICEEKAYNQKSDIWSLGCILYEFMTQKHAFDAQNMRGLMIKILKAQYQKIPENLNFSDEIKNLVYELLQKDPENRPSIKDILKKPFLQPVIDQFLSQKLKEKKETQEKQGKKENKSSQNQILKKNQSEIIQKNDNKEQNNSSSKTNIHQQSQQQFQLNSCRSVLQSDRSKQSEIIKNEQLINQIQNLNNENYIQKLEPKQKQQNNENNNNNLPKENLFQQLEDIRFYLEEQLGEEKFLSLYNLIEQHKTSDTEQMTIEQPNQQYLQYFELIQGVITIENSIFSN